MLLLLGTHLNAHLSAHLTAQADAPVRAQAEARAGADAPAPFRAEINVLRGADLLELRDGRKVRLSGITLPTPTLRPDDFVEQLRAYLQNRCQKKTLLFHPEVQNAAGDSCDLTAVVREREDQPSINEEVLEQGLAIYSARAPSAREGQELLAAGRRAQVAKKGWFANVPARAFKGTAPYLNGAVLGLYERNPAVPYHRHIEELHAAGFKHICFLFSALVPDVHGFRIDRHHRRTVSDARLIDSVQHAKRLGMAVMFLPIVLLDEATPDDWRGVLAPSDEARWWRNYDEFLAHYLDIAERHGVEIFSMGSELGSLELPQYTAEWQRLIQNARGRFTGLLTYSANWDHVTTARFFDDLDLIGMTAYFSVTDEHPRNTPNNDESKRVKNPTREQLEAGWRRIGDDLRVQLQGFKKPVFFTELGYASQDGINSDPWNYLIAQDRIDLKEQADCFKAFLAVVNSLEFLSGAYFFDYFEEGGPTDHSYSPRGKPAMEHWRRWAQWR